MQRPLTACSLLAAPFAAPQITSNLKNTITGMKAIVGKKFHSEDVQKEMDLIGYRLVDVAGKVGCPVMYNDEEVMITPERAMAMLMKCLQKIAEMDQGAPVTDVVVSVRARAAKLGDPALVTMRALLSHRWALSLTPCLSLSRARCRRTSPTLSATRCSMRRTSRA